MKKLALFLALNSFILANSLPIGLVCKKVSKDEVQKALNTTFKSIKPTKLPFEPPYNFSGCEYSNSVLPEVSINYYYKSSANVYPPDSKVKELKGLNFPARAVFAKNGDIFEIIGDTKEGSKILIVLNSGIKESSKEYNNTLKLLEKLVKEFK